MLKLSSHAPPTPPDKGYETQRPSERSGERESHSGCRWCVFPRNSLRLMFEKPKMHLNAISQDMTPGRHPARLTVVLKRLCAGGAARARAARRPCFAGERRRPRARVNHSVPRALGRQAAGPVEATRKVGRLPEPPTRAAPESQDAAAAETQVYFN